MYFPPHTQMLRTVPKLNRVTLRQAVMMLLCLGTAILSHIFITLITLFLPCEPRWSMRQGFHLQALSDTPALRPGRVSFSLSPRILMVPKTGLEPVRLATSDFESDKSTNFITRANKNAFRVGHPCAASHIFVIFSHNKDKSWTSLYSRNDSELALVYLAHKLCALRPGTTTLFFNQGRVYANISNNFFI